MVLTYTSFIPDFIKKLTELPIAKLPDRSKPEVKK